MASEEEPNVVVIETHGTSWTEAELDQLFTALPRYRTDLQALSRVLGGTKTVSQITALLHLLKDEAKAHPVPPKQLQSALYVPFLTRKAAIASEESIAREERFADLKLEREFATAKFFMQRWKKRVGIQSDEYAMFNQPAWLNLARKIQVNEEADIFPQSFSELYCALHTFLRPIIEDAVMFMNDRKELLQSSWPKRSSYGIIAEDDVIEALHRHGYWREADHAAEFTPQPTPKPKRRKRSYRSDDIIDEADEIVDSPTGSIFVEVINPQQTFPDTTDSHETNAKLFSSTDFELSDTLSKD